MKKTFKIQVKGKSVTVSIDRLKPAYTLINSSPDLVPTTSSPTSDSQPNSIPHPLPVVQNPPAQDNVRRTRSGRIVRFPDFYRP